MEDVVNFPCFWKIDPIRDVGYFSGYLERSILPWG